jgi:hypothetical protein
MRDFIVMMALALALAVVYTTAEVHLASGITASTAVAEPCGGGSGC